jgi:hypothetical protein
MSATWVRWALLLALLVAIGSCAPVDAQSVDGSYAGTIRCNALPRQRPLVTKVAMTVADGQAKYEREILDPNGGMGTGVFERGQGPVGPDGTVTLTTHATATAQAYSYDAEYKGRIEGGIARFAGTQHWKIRGQTGTIPRPCTLELMRNPS